MTAPPDDAVNRATDPSCCINRATGDRAMVARSLAGMRLCGSGAHSLSADSKRGSQSSGKRSLAGMTKTSMCVLHVTDREGVCQT